MKIRRITAALAALCCVGAFAQTEGGISEEMLKEIRKSYQNTAADKAVRNALNTTSISVLAENAANQAMIDTHFSDRVKTKGITNQKQ